MYQIAHVVNTFIYASNSTNTKLTLMKLQRMLYLIYAEYLRLTNRQLFSQRFEPWDYGPGLQSVYYAYPNAKTNHLKKYMVDVNGNQRMLITDPALAEDPKFTEAFNHVWTICKDLTGMQLCQVVRTSASAWYMAKLKKQHFLSDLDILHEAHLLAKRY
jgi:uncharacterized phage-associated protein